MAPVDRKTMQQHAHAHDYAIGGFDAIDPGFPAGAREAADRMGADGRFFACAAEKAQEQSVKVDANA